MSKPIPHYQQVGSRDPITGQRREWRKGERPIFGKGHKLNPRREVRVSPSELPPDLRPRGGAVLVTVATLRALGWPDDRIKRMKGAA